MSLETNIFILGILIVGSAFFSGVETALFSLSHIKARHLLDKGRKGSKALNYLKENPQRLLITILIGNNLVNIGASALATSVAIGLFQNNAVGIATGVMTLLILIFGEIIPKSVATRYNESISLLVAGPLKFLQTVMIPLVLVFEFIVVKMTGNLKSKQPVVTEKELITAVTIGEKEGQIKQLEKEMIHKIFHFDDTSVESVMTPMIEIFSVDEESKISDVIDEIIEEGYSRVPVYSEDRNNIVGVLLLKDMIEELRKKKSNMKVRDIMQMPSFVPDTKKIDKMLQMFQKEKQHMAVVVDEHGSVRGIVTIEDVLEEIVGEIVDETDKVETAFRRVSKKSYMVKGNTDIDDFMKFFNVRIVNHGFDTVSGYITHRLGRLPSVGEQIKKKKFTIIVREVSNNRVKKAKVILK